MNLHLHLSEVNYILILMTANRLAPQQTRSRETLRRLLQAAAEVLEEKGLEGATIPAIASRARLSPGSVYRRFRDKDALLRTLMLETLRQTDEHTAGRLTPDLAAKHSLAELARSIVASTLKSYRKRAGLLRAFAQFARSHPSAAFRRHVDEIEISNLRRIVDFLLLKRNEIRHPRPELALPFALLQLGVALREMVLLDVLSEAWSPLLPGNDEELTAELTRAFLNYLAASPP